MVKIYRQIILPLQSNSLPRPEPQKSSRRFISPVPAWPISKDATTTVVGLRTASGAIEVRKMLSRFLAAADHHAEDDDLDRRPPRRRYEEPAHIKLRKQLLAIAESVGFPLILELETAKREKMADEWD